MHYMERYFDMRIDPGKLVPGAKVSHYFIIKLFSQGKQQDDESKNFKICLWQRLS